MRDVSCRAGAAVFRHEPGDSPSEFDEGTRRACVCVRAATGCEAAGQPRRDVKSRGMRATERIDLSAELRHGTTRIISRGERVVVFAACLQSVFAPRRWWWCRPAARLLLLVSARSLGCALYGVSDIYRHTDSFGTQSEVFVTPH